MDDPKSKFIRQAKFLRKQYAYHVRISNGLGSMLAGGIFWLICLLNCLIGSGILKAFLILSLVVLWTYGKGLIKRKYYTALDPVREPVSRFMPWVEKLLVVLATGFALFSWAFLILAGQILNPYLWPFLFVISFLPFITWRYLRTPLDFVAGFYLWLLCAAVINGQPLGLTIQALSSLITMGVELFVVGLWMHLEYCWIVKDVKGLMHGYRRSITRS